MGKSSLMGTLGSIELGRAAGKDDSSFLGAFWDLLGIDLEEEIQSLAASGQFQAAGKLGALRAGSRTFASWDRGANL
jgi:hypothetical protein